MTTASPAFTAVNLGEPLSTAPLLLAVPTHAGSVDTPRPTGFTLLALGEPGLALRHLHRYQHARSQDPHRLVSEAHVASRQRPDGPGAPGDP